MLQREAPRHSGQGKFFLSWIFSTGSRICFLWDLITDIVAIPLTALALAFSTLFLSDAISSSCVYKLKDFSKRAGLSLVGAALSPWLVVEKIGTN